MNEYAPVSPREVLEQVASALPAPVRERVIVVGSLAAGFHFFGRRRGQGVRTKDADCLLAPRLAALTAGATLADELLKAGWSYHPVEEFPTPGTPATPTRSLPVLRLDPPGNPGWFLEVLGAHGEGDVQDRSFERLVTAGGHFALTSFRYLALAERNPRDTELGLRVARPEAMALANLLAHPTIRSDLISQQFFGRWVKRSNKDLGRVLAIADLSGDKVVQAWPQTWWGDLVACFGREAGALARRAGSGLRALLERPADLEEARHTCEWGLLAGRARTVEALRAIGLRLVQDAIEPLEALALSTPDAT